MARKGNLRGNGFEKNASVDIATSPELADMPLKKKGLKSETSVISEGSGYDKENVQNSDCRGKQTSSSRNNSHKSGGSENGKKGTGHTDAKVTKGRSAISRGSGTKATSSMSNGVSNSGEDGGQPIGNAVGSIVGEATENAERMANAESCGMDIRTQSTGSSHSGIEENVVNGTDDRSQHINGIEDRNNRASQAFMRFKQASEWIQQQKPVLIAWSAAALQARDYVISRIRHTWPIVYSWLLHFGKLSFLFLVLWLDCSLRGLSSLLHLGTTSFFVIIWCSFLSVIAMAGFFNVLLSLVAVCVIAFFVGYFAAISTMAVLGVVVLWMHGSFWMTGLLIIIAGIIFALHREHLALLITIVYSVYSVKCHVRWLGIVLCMNLAFISGDILIYFLKSGANDSKGKGFDQQAGATNGGARNFSNGSGYGGPSSEQGNFASHRSFGESSQSSQSVDNHGGPSTSGLGGGDPTSEEEVIRLLDSPDHYAVLGFSRYDNIDVAVLKREYRKKAMLVHPDKNMGNAKAEEAFKKLQNAYEVLLDSVKRKVYDEELRKDELISYFRRFQSSAQRNGRYGPFKHGYANFEDKGEGHPADSRRITCKKCNGSHVWIQTERTKAQARWCQDCEDYHQAKDGDGWVEQSGHTFLFGMLRKVDVPRAYACVESKIYDATEWLLCQGMKCPPNTHKPTFHVNTTIAGKNAGRGGSSSYKAGTNGGVPTNLDENMTEEEFFEWLQNAVASGMFDTGSGVPENAGMKTGNHAKSNKKKRKGKKQW